MFILVSSKPFIQVLETLPVKASKEYVAVSTTIQNKSESFDKEHNELLNATVGEHFSILHRIDAHILVPI